MGGHTGGQGWDAGYLRSGHYPEGQEEKTGGEAGENKVGDDEAFIFDHRHERVHEQPGSQAHEVTLRAEAAGRIH